MALIRPDGDSPEHQITNLDYDIALISNPGRDNEEVIFRFDGRIIANYKEHCDAVADSKKLTQAQKYDIFFWIGYFYGYLVRQ